MDLNGKLALVTGAAQGIGEATTRALAAAGARVILCDIDAAKGAALAAELGEPHRFKPLDVSDPNAWAELMGKIDQGAGGLDIVFLNAGVISRPVQSAFDMKGLEWFTEKAVQRCFGVNTNGVAYGLIHAFPLVQKRGGVIVATGSTAGIDVFEADPAYSASKAATIALVRSLAREYAEAGVRLCAVNPGSVDTRIYPTNFREGRARTGTLAGPEFLASAVLHIIAEGKPGELWMARPEDKGYWVYEPRPLPKIAQGEKVPEGQRFTPATAGIIQEG